MAKKKETATAAKETKTPVVQPETEIPSDEKEQTQTVEETQQAIVVEPIQTVSVKIKTKSREVRIPEYKTAGSAGMDVRVFFESSKFLILNPGESAIIPTGIQVQLPQGYEFQVRSRSGISHMNGLRAEGSACIIANEPGTVDADFTGEIGVVLRNISTSKQVVRNGERIAQLVLSRFEVCLWEQQEELEKTARGEKGFGSTGLS